jgi:hypothetical protein
MKGPFTFAVSLRLRHPSIDPAEVTTALGVEPQFQWKAGARRHSPSGQLLEGFYDKSYWTARLTVDAESSLTEVLRSHLLELEKRKHFLMDVRATGGSVEYFIGWFTTDVSGGETFDCELLRRLADLQIDLSFDVYGQRSKSSPLADNPDANAP